MKNQKSGNGVRVAKIVREVNEVINSSLTRKEKLTELNDIRYQSSGRPGNSDAIDLISEYEHKFDYFTDRKITGKYPRGEKRIGKNNSYYSKFKWNNRNWANAFEKHISEICPNVFFSLSSALELVGLSTYNHVYHELRPFANEIRSHYIELNKKAQEKAKRIEEFTKKTGLTSLYFDHESDINSVQKNKSVNAYRSEHLFCVVKGWYITVHHAQTEDWEYYAKSYGKPKVTIDNRWVQFSKNGKKHEINIHSFAGNYLFNTIIDFLKIKPAIISKTVKNSLGKNLKKVQLNKYFKVVKETNKLGFLFYKRTFAGEFHDYCVVDKFGNTFHAPTMLACIKGLNYKLKSLAAFDNEQINYKTAQQLGFCESGISNFCEDNNIDINKSYSRSELRSIVIKLRDLNCDKYRSELIKLGIALNCK